MLDRLRAATNALLGRTAPQALVRRFDAAGGGRRWESTPQFGNVPNEVMAAASAIRSRARYAVGSDPLAANAQSIYRTGLVGSAILAVSGHPDPAIAKEINDKFAAWAERMNFGALQGEVVDSIVRDGESVIVLGAGDDGLDLQHVAAEHLDESLTREIAVDRFIAAGVEYQGNRVAAYHLHKTRPTSIFANYAPPVRFDAADVLHIFRPFGPGAPRGISWFAPVLLQMADLNKTLDALGVSTQVQAMLVAFMIDQNGTGTGSPFGDGAQSGDISTVSLEPGTVRILPPGWDIRFSNPQQMAQSVEFAALSIRTIAAGLQIPEFLLGHDMSRVNYSSARTALVQFRQHLEQIQHTLLVPRFLTPVYRRWLTLAVLSGELDFPDFEERHADYMRVEWYPPAFPWVDPLKDIEAEAEAVANGFKSRAQVVRERGYSVEMLDAEIAADRAREAMLGLKFGSPAKPEKTDNPKTEEAAA